jgi:hypothetical protein
LARERNDAYQNKSAEQRKDMADNLLFVYVDTMSRSKAYLKLPHTMRFFAKKETYEMFKLHSFAGATFENAIGLMYGMTKFNLSTGEDNETHSPIYKEPFEEKIESFWDFFKRQGFITGYASDVCEPSFVALNHFTHKYLKDSIPDHEGISINCDPHYYDYQEGLGPW